MTVAGAPRAAERLASDAAPLSLAGADGRAEIGFVCRDGVTRLAHLYQRTPLRVMFPRSAAGQLEPSTSKPRPMAVGRYRTIARNLPEIEG